MKVQTNSKGVKFVSSSIGVIGIAESELAKSETNDCVVRAVATAFILSYDESHAWIKRIFKRKNRKGTMGCQTFFRTAATATKLVHGKEIEIIGEGLHGNMKTVYGVNKWNMTVGTFVKMYKEGTFLIFVRKHAFTVKDGVVIGNHDDALRLRVRVLNVYQVK